MCQNLTQYSIPKDHKHTGTCSHLSFLTFSLIMELHQSIQEKDTTAKTMDLCESTSFLPLHTQSSKNVLFHSRIPSIEILWCLYHPVDISLLWLPLLLVWHVSLLHGPLVEHYSIKLIHIVKHLPVVCGDAVLDFAVVVNKALLAIGEGIFPLPISIVPVKDVLGAARDIKIPKKKISHVLKYGWHCLFFSWITTRSPIILKLLRFLLFFTPDAVHNISNSRNSSESAEANELTSEMWQCKRGSNSAAKQSHSHP